MHTKFVRLKPYNPRGGYKIKRIDWRDPVSKEWFTFTRAGVWHKIDSSVADRMALCHQDQYDERSPFVFDVASEGEARAIDAAARAERERARELAEPTVDSAIDLTKPTATGAKRAAALDALAATSVAPAPVEPDDDEPAPVEPVEPAESKPEPVAARPVVSVSPTRRGRKPKRT